jgi:protein-tyrosine phosphatase
MTLKNFSWVLPGKLAGSDIPGRSSSEPESVRSDLQEMRSEGIAYLVSLEKPKGPVDDICAELGIQWNYFPIQDFKVPENGEHFLTLIKQIITAFESGKPVCVHCHAGVGRTGLVLSCVLGYFFSLKASDAIAAVRKNRAALDTPEQEYFVKEFLRSYEY